jgi:hypothetical protein
MLKTKFRLPGSTSLILMIAVGAASKTATSWAQPGPPPPTPAGAPTPTPPDENVAKPTPFPVPAPETDTPPTQPQIGDASATAGDAATTDGNGQPINPFAPRFPKKPEIKRPISDLPELLTAPTGYMLGAGYIFSRSGVDTGGGVRSDLRVGLGDVAEFGVATTDQVRFRQDGDSLPKRISPYITASFRMGVAENRLFRHQPALALGFRKSFQRERDSFTTQIAELTLVASKHLGKWATVHGGGAFWDASITSVDDATATYKLHDQGIKKQLRAFGGVAVRAIDKSDILIDVSWSPEFCYTCTDQIKLRALLSWGVRYNVADWIRIDAGVRVPDIQAANLLDAQIFGQVTFVSRRLRDIIDSVRE